MSVEYKDSGITFENRNFDGVLWYQPRALSESLSDSVTPSDSLIKGIDPVYADSASASDAIVKSFSIPLADSMTPSDDLVKLVSIPLADSVTVNDEIFNHPGKHLTDSATPIDAIIEKDVGKPIVDSITPVDSIITKHFGKVLSDSATADDTTDKNFSVALADSITITDLITVMKLDGTMPYVKPENTVFSEMRIKSIYGREPSNFYEIDEQGEEE